MTPTLGAVFGLAAVGAPRIAAALPLPRGLAELGLLVLAAGVGAATTLSPFVGCALAAGAAVSAAPHSPLRATLAAHAPGWRCPPPPRRRPPPPRPRRLAPPPPPAR